MLDCFDFAYGCICICVYSVNTFYSYKLLPLHWAFAVLWSFFFLFPFFFLLPCCFFFSLFYNFNFQFLKTYYIFSTFIPLFAFPTVLFPVQLIFNVYKSSSTPLFNFTYLFFLSFPLNVFVNFVFIALFPTWHLPLVLFSSLCFN